MHDSYPDSLTEFGKPRKLPQCGGWVLERQIQGFPDYDAIGCYPLFVCREWSKLYEDLAEIGNDLVTLSIVTEPFGDYDIDLLRKCFDVVIPFKGHFVADLSRPINNIVSAHHRSYARKALRTLYVEECQEPTKFIDEWVTLYDNLINKHNLKGIKAFSREAFTKQLTIPGTVMFRAIHEGLPVATQIWFVQGEVGYSHLTAFSEAGYKLRAGYALYWFAIEYFSGKVPWLDLGGGAGVKNQGKDGLSEFKRGWSTGTRTAYFCGRIFNRERYSEISKNKNIIATDYFPAYRKGEF